MPVRSLSRCSFLAAAVFGFFPASGIAQIVPDTSLGLERSIPLPTPAGDVILGGARRGANLFHSFLEFNVGESARVFFFDPGVANIFSRVTGGNPSRIFGTLGVTGGRIYF
jgi:large exoprotein involved in heme utilization and adhesion